MGLFSTFWFSSVGFRKTPEEDPHPSTKRPFKTPQLPDARHTHSPVGNFRRPPRQIRGRGSRPPGSLVHNSKVPCSLEVVFPKLLGTACARAGRSWPQTHGGFAICVGVGGQTKASQRNTESENSLLVVDRLHPPLPQRLFPDLRSPPTPRRL